jgi:hypothetical protein
MLSCNERCLSLQMITIVGSENALSIILSSEAVRNKLLVRFHSFLRVYKSPPAEKLVMPEPGVESGLRLLGAGSGLSESWSDSASTVAGSTLQNGRTGGNSKAAGSSAGVKAKKIDFF